LDTEQQISRELIRGHIDAIVLRLILEKDMYGFEIYKAIINKTEGGFELKEPSMYSCLRRLDSLGHIKAYWGDETHGGRRRYYSISESGKAYYFKIRKDWEFARKIIDMLI